MKKIWVFLQILLLSSAQITDIDCPFPWPPISEEEECPIWNACALTSSQCHMETNDLAGYEVTSGPTDTGRGYTLTLEKINPFYTMFENDIYTLTFEAIYHEEYHLQIKIYDPAFPRYEIPYPINTPSTADATSLYTLSVSGQGEPFEFAVSRTSTGTEIFKTVGPLSFENQFIQFTTTLPSEYHYGFGENSHNKFRRQFEYRETYPMFSRDQPPGNNEFNSYGVQPYYVNVEDSSGNTHSVLFYNSNAMEYSTFPFSSDSTPGLTLRTNGGIIDLHFFLGPTPEEVNMQYAKAVGYPTFPPYYALGFHLSRYGYIDLQHVIDVRTRMDEKEIPQDVQTFDIDYMYNERDFTIDPVLWGGLPDYVDQLHADGLMVTIILDPAVVIDVDNYPPYNRGRAADAFIKWLNYSLIPDDQHDYADDFMVGWVWPDNKTVFPDFMYPPAIAWWTNECQIFHDIVDYDMLWIDMNEPANFGTNTDRPFNMDPSLDDWSLKCPYTRFDNPEYPTKAAWHSSNECQRISDKTICLSGLQRDGTNDYVTYNTHSLYGLSQLYATKQTMEAIYPGERHLIYSRSTFPGAGQHVTHWLGDNTSNFNHLKAAIIGMLEFNLFAITNVGADVCGFFNNSWEELCARWMQIGAFYPFNRNHNAIDNIDQDPAVDYWPDVNTISRDVLLLRYKYNPYLYSLFYKSNSQGNSIIRPLWNIYPTDITARDIDDQFFWGEKLMIAPVIVEFATSRDIYFPQDYYYDLVTGVLTSTTAGTQTISAPLEKIPVYIRGGTIVPFQEPALRTYLSRQNPFGFTAALDSSLLATGTAYYDDGITANPPQTEQFIADLDFTTDTFTMIVTSGSTASSIANLNIETIVIYGYPSDPTGIDINGNQAPQGSWTYDTNSVLNITLSVPMGNDLTVQLL